MDYLVIDMPAHHRDAVKERINRKLVKDQEDGCWVWAGYTDKLGYGRLKVKHWRHPGRYMNIRVHRFIAFCSTNISFTPDIACSHLCHRPCCCNPQHLVIEPMTINNNRQNCSSQGRCTGHRDKEGTEYARCILPP